MSIHGAKLLVNYWQAMQTCTSLLIFADLPYPANLRKRLLVTCPQTPEIATCGDGCAFLRNTENPKQRKTYCRDFCLSFRCSWEEGTSSR